MFGRSALVLAANCSAINGSGRVMHHFAGGRKAGECKERRQLRCARLFLRQTCARAGRSRAKDSGEHSCSIHKLSSFARVVNQSRRSTLVARELEENRQQIARSGGRGRIIRLGKRTLRLHWTGVDAQTSRLA